MTNKAKNVSVELLAPITRGEGDKAKTITSIDLRRPATGELRGLKLADLLQMDVNQVSTLLPRITEPALTEAEIATLDPADLASMALEVVGFFTAST